MGGWLVTDAAVGAGHSGSAGKATAAPVAQLPPVVAAEYRAAVAAFREPVPKTRGRRAAPWASSAAGLDASAFSRVLHVDPAARAAVVGGMTTYEDLVDATL